MVITSIIIALLLFCNTIIASVYQSHLYGYLVLISELVNEFC